MSQTEEMQVRGSSESQKTMSSPNGSDFDAADVWGDLDDGEKRAVIAFKDFILSKEGDFHNVISSSPSDLGGILRDFYLAVREKCDDDSASITQLMMLRSALQSYFLKIRNIDIQSGSEFSGCNAFIEEIQALSKGAGAVTKKPHRMRTFTFEASELRQIYMGDAMNLDHPETLQNKVFFDVCMYICNRGKDFLRIMTKSDFEVTHGPNGRRFVWLKYDPKFSFREVAGGMSFESTQSGQVGDRMYERPGDPKCPVNSFMLYLTHLHPMSDAFWQRPKRSIQADDFVWYDNTSIGNSTLNKLMNRITTQAGLPDNYAINAIKSSYIPIIESICKSALFASMQFRRVLQMKNSNRHFPPNQQRHSFPMRESSPTPLYMPRKRHSEGSLTISNTLQESALFRGRHSESQIFHPRQSDHEMMRCNSASPVLHAENPWELGSPKQRMMQIPDSAEIADHLQNVAERERQMSELRERQQHESPGGQIQARDDEEPPGGSILKAKQKCLEIVHSLEVRDIKSFVNWMKTFQVEQAAAGLVVTCQPVQQPVSEQVNSPMMDTREGPPRPGSRKNSGDLSSHPVNGISSQFDRLSLDMDIKQVKFDKMGETCCSSELSPLKVTLPTQETVLLTGVQPETQLLIHKRRKRQTQSTEEKYKPLELRVYASDDDFDVEQIRSVVLRDDRKGGYFLQDSGLIDPQKSNCFTKMQEENTVPMKKRFVVDQNGGQNLSFPSSQSSSPPQVPPQFKRRIPDGWGYIPFDKRQRYGVLQTHEEIPLNLKMQ